MDRYMQAIPSEFSLLVYLPSVLQSCNLLTSFHSVSAWCLILDQMQVVLFSLPVIICLLSTLMTSYGLYTAIWDV